MWQHRRVTRKSLHFPVVGICDWAWGKAGVAPWLSELEGTAGCIQRVTSNWVSQSPRGQSRHLRGQGWGQRGLWVAHSGFIRNGLLFIYFVSGFFSADTRQTYVQSEHELMFRETASHKNIYIYMKQLQIYSQPLKKGRKKKLKGSALSMHTKRSSKSITPNLCHSQYPLEQMAAASWNLPLPTTFKARWKTFHDIQYGCMANLSPPFLAHFSTV